MCSLERTQDPDRTPTIVSTIQTPEKRKPLVPPGVGFVRVCVVRSRPESVKVNRPSGAKCLWSGYSFRWVLLSFTLRVYFLFRHLFLKLFPDDSERLRATSDDSGQLRATPDDSKRLQATSDDSVRFWTAPDDSKRFRIMLSGPTFQGRFRNYPCRIGLDSVFCQFYPALRWI